MWRSGLRYVAGIDEVGRGAVAGPVVVAAVVFWPWGEVPAVNDSKRLSPSQRVRLCDQVLRRARAVGIGMASAREIDASDIWAATCRAARRALLKLGVVPQHVLVDGKLPIAGISWPQTTLVRGDAVSVSVAAASIVAKVHRDGLMERLGRRFPAYHFHQHKGYATPLHLGLLRRLGPCPLHRKTFGPVAQMEIWE